MKRIIIFFIYPLIISLGLFGCAAVNVNSGYEDTSGVSADSMRLSEIDSIPVPQNSADTELLFNEGFELIYSEEELSALSISEKLSAADNMLKRAYDYQTENDLATASLYFENARYVVAGIEDISSNEEIEIYERIARDINHYYNNYVAGIEVLPEESPPEAVIAGVEEAEGDSLNGDNGVFTRPEVSFDSSDLEIALDTAFIFPSVPLERNYKVDNAISFFQNKGRKVFTKWLERAEYYIPLMTEILREEGLPEDLVYLSMIESGFNPKAYSYAHACGPWQFIRSTAKIFGLHSDYWYDERRDPVKSTRAASKYLKKLYLEFNDWNLAFAAYNCGEGKVQRHIRRYNTQDFWKLQKLPRQTRNYVPTYIAAAIIAKNPAEYGFQEIELKQRDYPDSAYVSECIDLELAAKMVDCDYQTLKELNPAIVRWCTPPTMDSIWLYLPKGTSEKFEQELALIPADQKRSWVRHKVRNGETLSTIARKYGTNITAISGVKENRITNKHRIKAGQYLLIPVPSHLYKSSKADLEYEPEYTPPPNSYKVIYTIRQGDNLSTIAEKYNISVSSLKRWNNLYGKKFIFPGHKLTIWAKSGESSPPAKLSTEYSSSNPRYHRVRNGESLWIIAKKYRVSVDYLKRINGLTGDCVIRPGDELLLHDYQDDTEMASSGSETIYTVKKGDTLWNIALEFGVRVSDLKRINNIDGTTVIRPGDQLIIPLN
ncbi:LysM peptidoglycan-binding domain-containing protein [bacterium]|nr:LysM peptidoglycan-binding domain-containing protein [FCB group bacterium]MBL7190664.1 LysM peptidoglycan-binding domain-containing protein [bacterium]